MDPCPLAGLGWAGLDCPPAEQGEAESQISSAHLAALDLLRGTETLPHGDRGRGGSDDWRPSAVNLGLMI